jgi:hypothetical protein
MILENINIGLKSIMIKLTSFFVFFKKKNDWGRFFAIGNLAAVVYLHTRPLK